MSFSENQSTLTISLKIFTGAILLLTTIFPSYSQPNNLLAYFQFEGPSEAQSEKLKLILVITLVISAGVLTALAWIIQSNRLLKKQYDKNKEQQAIIEEKNKELAIQNDNLKALNEEKNNVISYVSHDLMTPLVNIEGLIQLVELEPGNLTEDQKHYLRIMKEVSSGGKLMIHSMLNISKIELDARSIELNKENIAKILQEVILGLKIISDEKSIQLNINQVNEDLTINTDRQYLKQILSNLISNAIKFSPSGSSVDIDVNESDETIAVSVKDYGEGISKRDQDRIFLKYEQVSSRPKETISSGLGLAIVKQLVDKLNGKIRVESEPDKGSVFTVEFIK